MARGVPIKDEFTDLPFSHQYKNQLRMKRDNPERFRAIQEGKRKVKWWEMAGVDEGMATIPPLKRTRKGKGSDVK